MTQPIIPLGTRIPSYKSKVVAVGWVGERYYWLLGDDGGVSMVPADCLEQQAPTRNRRGGMMVERTT